MQMQVQQLKLVRLGEFREFVGRQGLYTIPVDRHEATERQLFPGTEVSLGAHRLEKFQFGQFPAERLGTAELDLVLLQKTDSHRYACRE